ncbi:cytochrome-c peroxidase, partial [Burkholderia glumae]|nr:cytochrome-c peroxidase [Burkholderia glumae]
MRSQHEDFARPRPVRHARAARAAAIVVLVSAGALAGCDSRAPGASGGAPAAAAAGAVRPAAQPAA